MREGLFSPVDYSDIIFAKLVLAPIHVINANKHIIFPYILDIKTCLIQQHIYTPKKVFAKEPF